jgi:hypothetical protein
MSKIYCEDCKYFRPYRAFGNPAIIDARCGYPEESPICRAGAVPERKSCTDSDRNSNYDCKHYSRIEPKDPTLKELAKTIDRIMGRIK